MRPAMRGGWLVSMGDLRKGEAGGVVNFTLRRGWNVHSEGERPGMGGGNFPI